MNNQIKAQIETLCRAAPTVESCGFCVLRHDGLHLYPCANTSPNPEEEYEISSQDFINIQSQGRILYVYHSHPKPGPFSPADLEYADELDIPQRLFDISSNMWHEYIPKTYLPPLEGRAWAWGEQDCFSIIRDYMRQTFGIAVGDYDRDENSNIQDMIMAGFEQEGGIRLSPDDPIKKHDVLILRCEGRSQHMAVFVGNSRMLHHPQGALSKIDQYSLGWQNRLTCILRHKDIPV